MKKYFAFFLLLFAFHAAEAKWVKFRVDMSGLLIDSNGVHIAGDFQDEAGFAADWDPMTTAMTQEAGSDVYSVKVNIPAFRHYEFKFFNGHFGYNVEFVPLESRINNVINDNRWIYVDSLAADTTMLEAIRFAGNAPTGKYLLRFYADLSNESSVDMVNGVHVSGSWQGMNPATTRMYAFDGDVYQHIAYIDSTLLTDTEWRFANGNSSASEEMVPAFCSSLNGYRTMIVSAHTMLDTVCFNACSACGPAAIGTQYATPLGLWPNPASTEVEVHAGDTWSGAPLRLFNSEGRCIERYEGSGNWQVLRGDLPAGLYLFVTEDRNGRALTGRLLFQ